MCLGIPGEVLEIDGNEANVRFFDVEKRIRLDIVGDSVAKDGYVLNHAGFAIRRIPDEQVAKTIDLYESLLENGDVPDGV